MCAFTTQDIALGFLLPLSTHFCKKIPTLFLVNGRVNWIWTWNHYLRVAFWTQWTRNWSKNWPPKSTVHDTIEDTVKLGLKVLFHAVDSHQYSLIRTSAILQELLSQIVNNQQDNSRETLSSHLELLPALKQLKELCMKQAIIVELLSGSHSFQQKTAETGYSGVDNIEDGWAIKESYLERRISVYFI